MPRSKVLEEHIAVFGESGSGKTVMLSSFYGSEQEPQRIKSGTFNVVAEDHGQGTRLHQNYLGMKRSATVPDQNRFASTSYRFLLKFKGESDTKRLGLTPFDALRLVWHDYPGEWFEQDVSGEEFQRRIETFRSLLGSSVALLLVDGQKLLDNAGEEERYLKSLLANMRNSLLLLRDDLLEDGQPLVTFPRIWMIALSKADLLPEVDVHAFKEMVVEKVGADIVLLREVIGELVADDNALSVGEDFVLMSSAKFKGGAIEVTERLGIDLILPIASVLPFERHVRWASTEKVSRRVASQLMGGAEQLASALSSVSRLSSLLLRKNNKALAAAGLALSRLLPSLEDAAKNASAKFDEGSVAAATKERNLASTLATFRNDLDSAEKRSILARSLG